MLAFSSVLHVDRYNALSFDVSRGEKGKARRYPALSSRITSVLREAYIKCGRGCVLGFLTLVSRR